MLQSFAPTETSHAFQWNGRDVYGRQVYGSQPAKVVVKHLYNAVYTQPAQFASAFALAGGAPLVADRGRNQIRIEQEFDMKVGSGLAPDSMIGGWSLNVHHQFDPAGGVVTFGMAAAATAPPPGSTSSPLATRAIRLTCSPPWPVAVPSSTVSSTASASSVVTALRRPELPQLRSNSPECHGPAPMRALTLTEGPGEQLYYAMSNVDFGNTGQTTRLCVGRVDGEGYPVNLANIALPQASYLARARVSVDKSGVIYASAGPYTYQVTPGGTPVLLAQSQGHVAGHAMAGDGSVYYATDPLGPPG